MFLFSKKNKEENFSDENKMTEIDLSLVKSKEDNQESHLHKDNFDRKTVVFETDKSNILNPEVNAFIRSMDCAVISTLDDISKKKSVIETVGSHAFLASRRVFLSQLEKNMCVKSKNTSFESKEIHKYVAKLNTVNDVVTASVALALDLVTKNTKTNGEVSNIVISSLKTVVPVIAGDIFTYRIYNRNLIKKNNSTVGGDIAAAIGTSICESTDNIIMKNTFISTVTGVVMKAIVETVKKQNK